MGKYLTEKQIERAKEQLSILYAMPFANDLLGTAWEQILADVKGGTWTMQRDNRPKPDLVVKERRFGTKNSVEAEDEIETNYSVKTEGLRLTSTRKHAVDFLGHEEDIIVARPKIDDFFHEGEGIATLGADELGAMVLRYYNEQIVNKFKWHVITFLLRLDLGQGSREFIYWEERPPTIYFPKDYWWKDSGKATGSNRNINGYPNIVNQESKRLPHAVFKWTSGGKQFYVLYKIPEDADIWTIEKADLSLEEVQEALRELLRRKQRTLGHDSVT
jgi:hypothetical protein